MRPSNNVHRHSLVSSDQRRVKTPRKLRKSTRRPRTDNIRSCSREKEYYYFFFSNVLSIWTTLKRIQIQIIEYYDGQTYIVTNHVFVLCEETKANTAVPGPKIDTGKTDKRNLFFRSLVVEFDRKYVQTFLIDNRDKSNTGY